MVPVDLDLAAKSLKSIDSKVYDLYLKIRDVGPGETEIRADLDTFYKLRIFLLAVEAIDKLERSGEVEVINDYRNGEVLVRRLYGHSKARWI